MVSRNNDNHVRFEDAPIPRNLRRAASASKLRQKPQASKPVYGQLSQQRKQKQPAVKSSKPSKPQTIQTKRPSKTSLKPSGESTEAQLEHVMKLVCNLD